MDKESDARERESEWQNSMYISVCLKLYKRLPFIQVYVSVV